MTFQATLLVAIAVMLAGGAVYYFNQEYPERGTWTRAGLVVLTLGFLMLFGTMIFMRAPAAH